MNGSVAAIFVGCIMLCSCASHDRLVKPTPAVTSIPTEGVSPGRLSESNLPGGECGMVLWTLDAREPAPIFRYVAGKFGEMSINDKTLALTRVQMNGASQFGVFEQQRFEDKDGNFVVTVNVGFALGFEGGVYLERGVVAIEAKDGWRTVSPSAGIAGCRAKS